MPSIEIAAVGQLEQSVFDDLPFAVIADKIRRSHRSSSRFQSDFDRLSGILYHLGNPDLKANHEGRCFFAYKLLSRSSQQDGVFLEFDTEYRQSVEALLAELIHGSPQHHVVFTSDWQFGPEWTKREDVIKLTEFWRRHDSHELMLNTLYPIMRDDVFSVRT
jgi:hypothetical protein